MLLGMLLVMLLAMATGCNKKESTGSKCIQGELQMSVKFSQDLGASGAPQTQGCPSRLSTNKGASPPVDAWKDGLEPFWGPELIVTLDKPKTAKLRDADEDKCIYVWAQGCH